MVPQGMYWLISPSPHLHPAMQFKVPGLIERVLSKLQRRGILDCRTVYSSKNAKGHIVSVEPPNLTLNYKLVAPLWHMTSKKIIAHAIPSLTYTLPLRIPLTMCSSVWGNNGLVYFMEKPLDWSQGILGIYFGSPRPPLQKLERLLWSKSMP